MDTSLFPELETPRLDLREITYTDVHELFMIYSNEKAMKWFGADPIQEIEQAGELVALFASWRTQANPGTRWGIQKKGSSHLIGTCGLFRWNRNWSSCTTGYGLSASEWGHGFMYEALRGVIQWGFSEMKLNRIEAMIHPLNLASQRVSKRLGFEREGYLREAGYWSGQYHDLLQYSLLKADWNDNV